MPNAPAVAKQPKPVAVLYGASTRHTRAIAERVKATLLAHGFPVEAHSLQGLTGFHLGRRIATALLAAVERGKQEQTVVDFVKAHRTELDRMPVALISIALGEAGDPVTPAVPGRLGQFEGDVQKAPNPFFAATGWHPTRLKSFAGTISYTRYNFFVRLVMRLLGGKERAEADMARGRDNAGWDALDVFVAEFVQEIRDSEAGK
jgi:menaquinone-dependent protoporphyrinogen IX oxidase